MSTLHGLIVVCYSLHVAPQTQKFKCPQCGKGEANDTWSAERVKVHLDEHHSDYYDDWPHVQVDTGPTLSNPKRIAKRKRDKQVMCEMLGVENGGVL